MFLLQEEEGGETKGEKMVIKEGEKSNTAVVFFDPQIRQQKPGIV